MQTTNQGLTLLSSGYAQLKPPECSGKSFLVNQAAELEHSIGSRRFFYKK